MLLINAPFLRQIQGPGILMRYALALGQLQTFETLETCLCFWHVIWVEAGIELHPEGNTTAEAAAMSHHAADVAVTS